MSSYSWRRFTFWDVTGELLWVLLYGEAGYIFSDRINAISELLGNLSWAIAGDALTLFLAYRVWRHWYPPWTATRSRFLGRDGYTFDLPTLRCINDKSSVLQHAQGDRRGSSP